MKMYIHDVSRRILLLTRRLKSLLIFFISGMALCICLPSWSQAMPTNTQTSTKNNMDQDRFVNFMDQIEEIDSVEFATVVIYPNNWYPRIAITETSLIDRGCIFSTGDPLKIANLIELLKNSKITNNDELPEQEPREEILFTLRNKSEIKFFFSQKYNGQDHVRGSFSHLSTITRHRITADQSLPDNLNYWALAVGTPTSKAPHNQHDCEWSFDLIKAK